MDVFAYLFALFQRTDGPPYLKFLEASVHPVRYPDTSGPEYLDLYLLDGSGPTYEAARADVLKKAKATWSDDWVEGILSAGIGVIR